MALLLICGLNNRDFNKLLFAHYLFFCFRAVLCDGKWRLRQLGIVVHTVNERELLDSQSLWNLFFYGRPHHRCSSSHHGIVCHRCYLSRWCKWWINGRIRWHSLWLSSKGSLSPPPSCLSVHGTHDCKLPLQPRMLRLLTEVRPLMSFSYG